VEAHKSRSRHAREGIELGPELAQRLQQLDPARLDALTPSERRVAQMAADGQTNREIAQALFVTPKTVETHLSHIFRKLEIQSRSQLSGALESVHHPAA
jgi:DNA-binding NarL/FixJ family response regulator